MNATTQPGSLAKHQGSAGDNGLFQRFTFFMSESEAHKNVINKYISAKYTNIPSLEELAHVYAFIWKKYGRINLQGIRAFVRMDPQSNRMLIFFYDTLEKAIEKLKLRNHQVSSFLLKGNNTFHCSFFFSEQLSEK